MFAPELDDALLEGVGHALDGVGGHALAGQIEIGPGSDTLDGEAAVGVFVALGEVDDKFEVVIHGLRKRARYRRCEERGLAGLMKRWEGLLIKLILSLG